MRSRYASCSSCGARILWMRTPAGKGMPCEPDTVPPGDMMFDAKRGHVSHFAMCPNRAQHRKDAPKEPAEPAARQLALLPDLIEPPGEGWGDVEAPAPTPERRFMTEERIRNVTQMLQAYRIPLEAFRAIRTAEGIDGEATAWSETEYYQALGLLVRTAMLRDAAAKGLDAYLEARAKTGLEYEDEEFRRLLAGERKETA